MRLDSSFRQFVLRLLAHSAQGPCWPFHADRYQKGPAVRQTILSSSLVALLALGASACATEEPAEVKSEGSAVITGDGNNPSESDAASDEPVVDAEEPDEVDEAPELAKVGATVSVGSWDVKVTEINLDAGAIISRANQFNDPPKGQYVLVTYEATYTGNERMSDVEWDLSWSFTDTDQKVSDYASVVTPADDEEWPSEARKGGTVRYQVAFDVPSGKIKGGILSVEGTDDNYDTVYADFSV